MHNNFSDSPISEPSQDKFGVVSFADTIAKSLIEIKYPNGTAIAIQGPWGAGKSSIINLIRKNIIDKNLSNLIISEFRCWWYKGEEALALAFLQTIYGAIAKDGSIQVGRTFKSLARRALQAGPVVGAGLAYVSPILGPIAGAGAKYLDQLFEENSNIDDFYRILVGMLEKQEKKHIIIIDDLDRLSTEEMVAVLRMIKSFGKLPKLIYLLSFDRKLTDSAISNLYPSEGPQFLEKIIQAGFDLPMPLQSDLNEALLSVFQKVCGEIVNRDMMRFLNIFYDVIVPYVKTPRDVNRLHNIISVTWPAIAGEINCEDYLALETVRLFDPNLFNNIIQNRNTLTNRSVYGKGSTEKFFEKFLEKTPPQRHEAIRFIIRRIFPNVDNVIYGDDIVEKWELERRVCINKHFETYLRLSLNEEVISSAKLEELIQNCNDEEYVRNIFVIAASRRRKNLQTYVPVYLDALMQWSQKIEKDKIKPLLKTLFSIYDIINDPDDYNKGIYGISKLTHRYHWLVRRLTSDKFSLHERSLMYREIVPTSQLGWLVDFTSSALDDYNPEDGETVRSDEKYLTTKEHALELRDIALSKIRASAKDGSLVDNLDLIEILYRWKEFSEGQTDEIAKWVTKMLAEDKVAIKFARAMTGVSWSQSMGFDGLGDRAAKISPSIRMSKNSDFLDLAMFQRQIERINRDQSLDKDSLTIVSKFLEASRNMRKRIYEGEEELVK